jgi:glucokinase
VDPTANALEVAHATAEVGARPLVTLGVDVGGTKVALAMLREGRLTEHSVHATDGKNAAALIEQLIDEIQAARARARDGGAELAAVGLGIPSVIEFATGRVRSSVNVPLRDVPLREVLRERLGMPVYVDNDATCAALAEAHAEDGSLSARDLVMVTVGTGVGGGIVIDGRIYRGATGAAGEVGHMLIGAALEDGPPVLAPHPPQPDSLEALAAGRALDRLAVRAAREHPDSALGRLAASGAHVAGPDAVAAAHDGDPAAVATIALLGHRLGVGIANLVNIFDPEVVAVGGGVSAAGELLLAPARETARAFILPGVGTATEIRLARSGAKAGVRGAALLARQELELELHRGHE